MKEVSLENFRCFHERQTARLAPLTLLVGENSTGKTSFMALVRALLDLAAPFPRGQYSSSVFNIAPYNLGSFDEIAHHRGSRGSRANRFRVGYLTTQPQRDPLRSSKQQIRCEFTFGKKATAPRLIAMRVSDRNTWIDVSNASNRSIDVTVGTKRGIWKWNGEHLERMFWAGNDSMSPYFILFLFDDDRESGSLVHQNAFIPLNGSPRLTEQDLKSILKLANLARRRSLTDMQPRASAPVRSRPLRTYDPLPPEPDPEGNYIPMYYSSLASSEPIIWKNLKKKLQEFGKNSGLFNELSIRHLGNKRIEPFQVQVRKFGSKHKGPRRNIIDVGYGVSQVLPLITELLQTSSRSMFLTQQPEVHLHPSAQAALGSFFCQIANWKRQVVVETHSDYIIDRIRMDVRDKKSNLRAEDVSILYFEREDLDSKIHCLRLDDHGNIENSPDNYRRFFMKETDRLIGF